MGAEGQNYFSQTTFPSNKEDRKCEGLWTTGNDFRSRGPKSCYVGSGPFTRVHVNLDCRHCDRL
jgi:hypothetical protein